MFLPFPASILKSAIFLRQYLGSFQCWVTYHTHDKDVLHGISEGDMGIATSHLWPSQSSVQFTHSVMSNSLWPHGLQHARLPLLSPSLGVCSNSDPLSGWYHPSVSSPVASFSCSQSFPASESSPVSWLFASGGQSIGASPSVSSEYSRLISFKIDLFDLLAVQGTFKSLLQHHSSKASVSYNYS